MPELAEWESFYVIVGGGAAALIGLQFVVLTLIAEKPQLNAPEAGAAFATPTIVHFSTVLLIAAVLRVPWQGVAAVSTLWGIVGLSGAAYTVLVARRVRRDGIATLEPKSVRKKLKQPSFAAGVHREEVYRGAEELGVDLDEHIAFVVEAMRPIAGQLGLRG